jgi:hypothetical protein
MLTTDRPGQTTDDDVSDAKPACVALVPIEEPARLSRPDPTFVTHLIATAEQVPQTRVHRRAAQADALSAYQTDVINYFRILQTNPYSSPYISAGMEKPAGIDRRA